MVVVARKMADRIQWSALRSACKDLNLSDIDNIRDFNGEVYVTNDNNDSNNSVSIEDLKVLHHLLFEIHVMDGELVCPESGRLFSIKEGIPNMLLHEDEVGDGGGGESVLVK